MESIANTRTRLCAKCGVAFTYEVGKGKDRKYCTPACREAAVDRTKPACQSPGCVRLARAKNTTLCSHHYTIQRKERAGVCVVHKCQKPAVRVGHGLCEMHYCRMRRSGTFDPRERKIVYHQARGYVIDFDPDHPLARKGGLVFQHRKVLFAAIGDGPHACHWCKREVGWLVTGEGKLVVDHLDGNKQHNELTNLVPSCHRCNSTRGLFQAWVMEHKDDPFLAALFANARAA